MDGELVPHNTHIIRNYRSRKAIINIYMFTKKSKCKRLQRLPNYEYNSYVRDAENPPKKYTYQNKF